MSSNLLFRFGPSPLRGMRTKTELQGVEGVRGRASSYDASSGMLHLTLSSLCPLIVFALAIMLLLVVLFVL